MGALAADEPLRQLDKLPGGGQGLLLTLPAGLQVKGGRAGWTGGRAGLDIYIYI